MRIELLDARLVPYECLLECHHVFELFVHGIAVCGEARVTRVRLVLEEAGNEKMVRVVEGAELDYIALRSGKLLPAFRKYEANFVKRFGTAPRVKADLADSCAIGPGQEMWLTNLFLQSRGIFPTHLRVDVEADGDAGSAKFELSYHEPRNLYRLPFGGPVLCVGAPAEGCGHREVCDQEFALDLLPLDEGLRVFTGDGDKNEDFCGYRREILAPADGTVVAVRDGMEENGTIMQVPKVTREDVEKWGMERISAGNHLVIDHGEGEFSLIAHCAKGSFLVAEGQKVACGEKLALVGNTGNSEAPHVHFHVMDRADMLSARSLPVTFRGVEMLPLMERFEILKLPYERAIMRNFDENGVPPS